VSGNSPRTGYRVNQDYSPIPIPPNLISCDGNPKRGSDLQQSMSTLELCHTARIVGFGEYDLEAKVSEIDRSAYTEPNASAQAFSMPWEEFGLVAEAAGGSETDRTVPYGRR
jgi:hypothetical protein